MPEAFVCDAVRTPIGRYAGALAPVRADDLGAVPIRALMQRNGGVDWGAGDEEVFGCANQGGEGKLQLARTTALRAEGADERHDEGQLRGETRAQSLAAARPRMPRPSQGIPQAPNPGNISWPPFFWT